MPDRATVVARVAMQLLIGCLNREFTPSEYARRLETLLRDEFADERRQIVADRRELPDDA